MTNLERACESWEGWCEVTGFDDMPIDEYEELDREAIEDELLCGYGIDPHEEFEE